MNNLAVNETYEIEFEEDNELYIRIKNELYKILDCFVEPENYPDYERVWVIEQVMETPSKYYTIGLNEDNYRILDVTVLDKHSTI